MKKLVFIFISFFLFLSCGEILTTEQQIAKTKAKMEAKERSKFSVEVIKHPDYYFERTNPEELILYDGFKPKKKYLIIGKISIRHLPDAKVELIKEEVDNKVSMIGGNAILIFEKRIGKTISSDTFGIFMPSSLLKYFQTTTEKEKVSSINYYGYVIRWINSDFKTILAAPLF